jgi:hypothetical protein
MLPITMSAPSKATDTWRGILTPSVSRLSPDE